MNSVSLYSLLLNVFIFKFKNVKDKNHAPILLSALCFSEYSLEMLPALTEFFGKGFLMGFSMGGLNSKCIQWMQDIQSLVLFYTEDFSIRSQK